MKKMFLGTNWKMNKTTAEGLSYTDALTDIISKYPEFEFFIIPPYVQLWKIRELIDSKKSTLKLGAQNVHYEDAGQFTGEISPTQLKEIGVDILEIGHSERRQYFNETDYTVNLKTLAALKHGFTPLVCIGDSMQDKKYGVSKEVLARQLKIALHDVPADAIGKFWVAYEPVWAIGVNGIPAEAPLVNDIHNICGTSRLSFTAKPDAAFRCCSAAVSTLTTPDSMRPSKTSTACSSAEAPGNRTLSKPS